MRLIYKYILVLASLAVFASCSVDEINEVGRNSSVKFVARPTSFTSFDVATKSTKALTNEELSTLEGTIHTIYFMAFDNDSDEKERIVFQKLDLASMSVEITTDYGTTDNITACFLANVPYSYANSLTKLSSLYDNPLPIDYAPYSGANGTGYIGVPSLNLDKDETLGDDANATNCFPMFGIGEFSLSQLTNSNVPTSIALKRLFAKVNVELKVNLEQGILDQFASLLGRNPNVSFSLNKFTLTNLPKKVRLIENRKLNEDGTTNYNNVTESVWRTSTSDADFKSPINLDYSTPVVLKHGDANSSYQITFYVPEYAVLPKSGTSNTDQAKKTLSLLDSGERPVFITFSGLFDSESNLRNLNYNLYLGENAVQSFSLFRNTLYNNSMTIVNTNHLSSGVDNRVELIPLNLVEYYGQAANCYIISSPGTYEIDAYKGVVKSATTTPDFTGKPYIVWNDNNNSVNLLNETVSDSKVTFTVNDNGNAITPGNAVIAIRDASNNILWSWHLWFNKVNDRPDTEGLLEKYVNNSGYFNNNLVMNRPLGATKSTGIDLTSYGGSNYAIWEDGLYYQWGRKDPLGNNTPSELTTVTGSDIYTTSTQNPNSFCKGWTGASPAGWSSSKSINDPCPPGYKVPSNSIWRTSNPDADYTFDIVGFDLFKATTEDRYTYNLSIDFTGNNAPSPFIFYGYGANYDENGKLVEDVSSSITEETKEGDFVYYGVPDAGYKSYAVKWSLTPKQFRNIKFKFDVSVGHGAYWANDKNSLTYGYSFINSANSGILSSLLGGGYTIISCEYRTGTANYTTSGSFIKTYTYDGTVNWSNSWSTLTESQLNSTSWTLEKASIKNDLDDYLKNNNISTETYIYELGQNTNTPASSLQIRCVKE